MSCAAVVGGPALFVPAAPTSVATDPTETDTQEDLPPSPYLRHSAWSCCSPSHSTKRPRMTITPATDPQTPRSILPSASCPSFITSSPKPPLLHQRAISELAIRCPEGEPPPFITAAPQTPRAAAPGTPRRLADVTPVRSSATRTSPIGRTTTPVAETESVAVTPPPSVPATTPRKAKSLLDLFSPMFNIFGRGRRAGTPVTPQIRAEAMDVVVSAAAAAEQDPSLVAITAPTPQITIGAQRILASLRVSSEELEVPERARAVGCATTPVLPPTDDTADGEDEDDEMREDGLKCEAGDEATAFTDEATELEDEVVDVTSEEEDGAGETPRDVEKEDGYAPMAVDEAYNPFVFIKRLLPLRGSVAAPSASPALGPKGKGAPKNTLVLDLDETLVHCSTEPIQKPDVVFPVNWNGVEYKVYAKKRPGLERFMEEAAKLFEVVVFTASQKVYADRLLDIIDPAFRWFSHRLFRDSCVFVEGNYLKDLSVLGRDLSSTIIIDNSPQAFGFQYNNGIPILSWYEDESDSELLKLLPFLRKLAASNADVRPALRSRYKLWKHIEC